jgi:hypothetical protein
LLLNAFKKQGKVLAFVEGGDDDADFHERSLGKERKGT